ncbi:MAG: hypothetical protein ABJG47_19675 [Ekhidna sp.]
MKKIQIILLVCLTVFSCDVAQMSSQDHQQTVEVPEVYLESRAEEISVKPNGDVYLNESLFSGYIISRHRNDSISLKKGYVNGKQQGITTAYYPNGLVKYERPYLAGEKHGVHLGYYPDGNKKFKYYFEYGFSEGNHLTWYKDGQKSADMNYANGKEFGKQQAWRPDGKLRSNYIVRENGRMYGLQGIKRCTKLDGVTQTVDPYKGKES